MELKDLMAMEVPLLVMKEVAAENHIKVRKASADEYAEVLTNHQQTRQITPQLVKEFRYAGNTSVNLVKPLSGSLMN